MPITLPQPHLENNSQDGWPVEVDLKFILPGLVFYEELKNTAGEKTGGTVLVKKEAFDKMNASAKGKPIVNWDHRAVDSREFDKGSFQGVVTGPAFFNAVDGWYHAPALVWNKQTLKNIQNGFSVSCAYQPVLDTKPGFHNQVPYQAEVVDGEYTHFAVVSMPRYEEARIELLNSGGHTMGLLSFFRKDKPEEKVEFDPALTRVPVEGLGDVPLLEMVNSYKAVHAKPAAPSLTDLIDVDGVKVPLSELLNAHKTQLENALKDEHEDGKHKDAPKENCGMCNSAADEDKKAKEAEEHKNAVAKTAKEAAEKKAAEELKNAAEKTAREKAEAESKKLEELRNKGQEVKMPEIKTLEKMMADGQDRYGSKTPAAAK